MTDLKRMTVERQTEIAQLIDQSSYLVDWHLTDASR